MNNVLFKRWGHTMHYSTAYVSVGTENFGLSCFSPKLRHSSELFKIKTARRKENRFWGESETRRKSVYLKFCTHGRIARQTVLSFKHRLTLHDRQ